MKACFLRAPAKVETNPLAIGELPKPEPGPGEILVRVEVCGVCRTDLHVVEGDLPPKKSPVIPGHQAVGHVAATGAGAERLSIGSRVGVAWLHKTDGTCEYCRRGEENLCDDPQFTGYTVNGGYAEYLAAAQDFVYALPENLLAEQAAPLLCAGISGYRCLRLSGVKSGGRLGLYGFCAACHLAVLAKELGAVWTGGSLDAPPKRLDAAIVFAPAGEIVPAALASLKKGGRLILGGIHMSDIPSFSYDLLYQERAIRSVANNTREDGEQFLQLAAEIPVRTHVQVFPLTEANQALNALKNDAIRGAAVLRVNS